MAAGITYPSDGPSERGDGADEVRPEKGTRPEEMTDRLGSEAKRGREGERERSNEKCPQNR